MEGRAAHSMRELGDPHPPLPDFSEPHVTKRLYDQIDPMDSSWFCLAHIAERETNQLHCYHNPHH